MEFIVVFHISCISRICYTPKYGKPEHIKGGLPSVIGGANPPDERKEGDANVCYISGLSSDWNIHCSPCRIVLYNLSRKKIAATTRNSDGSPLGL